MADSRTPYFRAITATSVGQFLSWAALARMGRVYVRNAGPDEVFIRWEALPTVAAIGDGRFRLQVGESINLDVAKVDQIGLRTAVGDSAVVEAAAFVGSGSNGAGIA